MMVAQDGPPRTDTQHLRACTAVSQGLSPWKSEDFRHPIHAAPGLLMETQFEAEWNIWGQFSKLKIYLETCEYFLLPSPSFPELLWFYARLDFTGLWVFFSLQFGHIYFLSWFRKWNRGAEQDRRDLTFLSRMWPQHPLTPGLSVHSGLCKKLYSSWRKPWRCCFGLQRKKQLCTFTTFLFNRSIQHRWILATFLCAYASPAWKAVKI